MLPAGLVALLMTTLVLAPGPLAHAQASDAAGPLGCAPDDALTEAALALYLEPGFDGARVGQALRDAGSDLPSAHARRLRTSAEAAAWVARLRERSDAPLSCGEVSGPEGTLVVAAARAGRLRLEGDALVGWVDPRFREPRWVVVERGGEAHWLPFDRSEPRLERGGSAREVQLLASGPGGPRPVASLRFQADDTTEEPELPEIRGGSLEDRLVALREHFDAPGLRNNRLLTSAARAHARRVCREHRVAHVADGRDPEARLAGEGIRARHVGEVVARAAELDAAFQALMRSASHRLTMIDRRFTDVGVGLVRDSDGTCVVIDFAAWPRYVGR